MSSSDISEILQRLATIEVTLEEIKKGKHNPITCALHSKAIETLLIRIEKAEDQIGKNNLLKLGLGAIGFGIALAAKYVWGLLS